MLPPIKPIDFGTLRSEIDIRLNGPEYRCPHFVAAHESQSGFRNLEIGLLDAQTAFDVGRRVNRPDADAVMLACGNWSTFSIIDRLEADLGKPVLTTNQVSLWHALKMMGARPLDGPGVLLRQHLGDEAARHTVGADT